MKPPVNWGAILAVIVVAGLLMFMFSSMDRSKVEVFGVRSGEKTVTPELDPRTIGVFARHANNHNHEPGVDHEAWHKEQHAIIEKALFTEPFAKYTAADIKANGPKYPSQKFAFIPQRSDLAPIPGEPICPVTKTRANANIKWQIDGKSYTFCSSVCVEEFVFWAKEQPKKVKAPETYRAPSIQDSASRG